MHGMTKFVMLYGSAMNSYGGPGEAKHKIFVKVAGLKTQCRVCEFAQQTANQYYSMMLTNYAMQLYAVEMGNYKQQGTNERDPSELVTATDAVTMELSGRYEFRVSEEVLRDMEELGVINVAWPYDPKREKKYNHSFHLHKDLVRVIYRKLSTLSIGGKDLGSTNVVGFTSAVMITSSKAYYRCTSLPPKT